LHESIVDWLLAVTNDQIRTPIIIQNRRNKHAFDTYAFTIDLVPLVFEKTCFVGHKFEYKWKTYQKAQTKDVKQKCANKKRIRREAHLRAKPRPNTNVEGA
jgi:amino acid permease